MLAILDLARVALQLCVFEGDSSARDLRDEFDGGVCPEGPIALWDGINPHQRSVRAEVISQEPRSREAQTVVTVQVHSSGVYG
jgi:hypothetical protein